MSRRSTTGPSWRGTSASSVSGQTVTAMSPTCSTLWWSFASAATTPTSSMVCYHNINSQSSAGSVDKLTDPLCWWWMWLITVGWGCLALCTGHLINSNWTKCSHYYCPYNQWQANCDYHFIWLKNKNTISGGRTSLCSLYLFGAILEQELTLNPRWSASLKLPAHDKQPELLLLQVQTVLRSASQVIA